MTMRRLLLVLLLLAAALPARAACPPPAEVARFAAAFLERRTPPPPPANLSMEDALCTRERLVALLAQPFGPQVGWKVGLTNPAAQRRFGVSQPVAGAIFEGTIRERAGHSFPVGGAPSFPARFSIVPVIESDLLLRIRDEGVNEAGDDHLALLRHVEAVIPFLELPDLVHGPDAPWSAPLIVAINVGARFGVLGEAIPAQATPDFARALAAMTVTLRDDTRELARAPGTALLDHPLNALAWLVRDLRGQGRRLRAGEYVALGSFSPPVPAEAGRTYTATYEGLAPQPVSVSVRIR